MRLFTSWVVGVALLLGLWVVSGCGGPELSERELGRVLDKVPPLPGMDDDYKDKLRHVPPNPDLIKRYAPPIPPKVEKQATK